MRRDGKRPESHSLDQPPGARVGALELIPQPHGGALVPRQYSPARTPWRGTKGQALELLRDGTIEAVTRLRELVRSPDDRVAMVAIDKVMLYLFGPPPPGGMDVTSGLGPIDLSALTADERGELTVAYGTVQRLLATATERRA